MRSVAILTLALGLLACTPSPPPVPGSGLDQAGSARAMLVGQHMRAALACSVAVPMASQDRAAAIEAAALAHAQRQGGTAARDAYLRALAAPVFDPRRAGRDHAAWCTARRPDIDRVVHWLDSAPGAAFAAHAAGASQP